MCLTQNIRQHDFTARQYHHRLRWGRAIENYLWPIVTPAFAWQSDVRFAFLQTVCTFATVAKNFFPRQCEEGLGWLGFKKPGGHRLTSLDYAEQILKRIVTSDLELSMMALFVDLMLSCEQFGKGSIGPNDEARLSSLAVFIELHAVKGGAVPDEANNKYGVAFFDACVADRKAHLTDNLPKLLSFASQTLTTHVEYNNRGFFAAQSASLHIPPSVVYISKWLLLRFQEEFWSFGVLESLSGCSEVSLLAPNLSPILFKLRNTPTLCVPIGDIASISQPRSSRTMTIDQLALESDANPFSMRLDDIGVVVDDTATVYGSGSTKTCPGLLISIYSDESSKPESVVTAMGSWLCLACGELVSAHDALFETDTKLDDALAPAAFFSALCVVGSYGWDSHSVQLFVHKEDCLGKSTCNTTEDLFNIHEKHFSAWLPESSCGWFCEEGCITRQSSKASTLSGTASSAGGGNRFETNVCTVCDNVALAGGKFLQSCSQISGSEISAYTAVKQHGMRLLQLRRSELKQIGNIMNTAMTTKRIAARPARSGLSSKNKK